MANYNTLADAINAELTNMTYLRNNSKNDDGTTNYNVSSKADWFNFNGNSLTNIYSSGNSWIGFNSSSENLKVNRRDSAVYNELEEHGTIAGLRFYRFRWDGYSVYNSTSSSYRQSFEFFIFEPGSTYDEIVFLRFFNIPTSSFDGTNSWMGNSFSPSSSSQEFYWEGDEIGNVWSETRIGRPTFAPPAPPAPTPAIVYNFTDGLYRAFIRSTFKIWDGSYATVDSNIYEFGNRKPDLYTFWYYDDIQVDMRTGEPYVNENAQRSCYFDPENIVTSGSVNGLDYVIYGAHAPAATNEGRLCVITGTQTSATPPSGGYPWWPGNDVTRNMLIYADANFISFYRMFDQDDNYNSGQAQITIGKRATFPSPVDCTRMFANNYAENVYMSYLQCVDNISGRRIQMSSADSMFGGTEIEFVREYENMAEVDRINCAFWNSLDFSVCTTLEEMFNECHGGASGSARREIDFSNHNLQSVESIYAMFRNCSVAYVNFGNTLNPNRAYALNNMFYGQMNNVTITEFNFPYRISGASNAFSGCYNLTRVNLHAPEPVKTSTNWESAFYRCGALEYIDLTNQYVADASSSSYKGRIFTNCNNIKQIDCPYESGYQIRLPITMYNADGVSTYYLSKYNIRLFSDATGVDWFDFVRTTPYTLVDSAGTTVTINDQTSVLPNEDGTKKYKVYNGSLIVGNDNTIVYPSEYDNTPKWIYRDISLN